ncbi:MAG: hypothetical protein U1B77_03990, partial [Dehalococcoidales bacterium]|nr:hypothetical protein [Dehalococcoidales bacterium]
MKKKINKIMGVGLSLMLLASLWVMAIPATAGTLSLGEESSVKDLKAMVDNIIGPAGVDIVDMAVNGNVIYAATGTTTTDNITYKSTDGGATWTSLITTTNYPASAVTRVAVAPDDPDVVIIATAEPQVYLSNNGGGEWDNLAIPAVTTRVVTINSIDISAGATRYVAIGGATTGSVAELWTLKLAMAQNWQARMAGSGNFTASQTAVMAAKFSPNSVTDETIAVISADAGTTTFQLFRFTEGQTSWNQGIAREGMSSYGTGIALDTGIVGGVAAADIELVSDYLATDLTRRIAFVTSAGATSGGKVYRMTDAARVGAFNEWDDATDVTAIGSLSLNAANSVLLGGRYLSNVVFSWSNPTSGGSPNALRTNTLKLPSGGLTDAKTLVGWNGDTAIAATSGDESAFSVSTDNGYSWNDISLIDTTLTTLNDVAVNADASKIYLTSADATNDTSVWLKTSAGWKRVLSMQGMTATTSPFLVRLAPENDSVVYIASKMTTNMWLSVNGGLETWRHVPAYQLTAIQDFVVESADVVHAIDTSGATKTTNAGATWSTKKNLDGLAGHSITLAPNNDVLVGGSDGYVAFSKDG